MKVVYDPRHRLHAPEYAFAGGRRVPHADVPERAECIAQALRAAGHEFVPPAPCPRDDVRAVHSAAYLHYLERALEAWHAGGREGDAVIPSTFAVRPVGRLPSDLSRRAGLHCLDTETPVRADTLEAALVSAGCALAAADLVLGGEAAAYALCRPPGHHAGRDFCGGYCYLNNAALAAERLLRTEGARVAILDLDAHHGNGTQDVFYARADVLYCSLHADPDHSYPYFWGYAEETGAEPGAGRNLNLPLPSGTSDADYLRALDTGLCAVTDHAPAAVVVSLGTDAAAGDPLGALALSTGAFRKVGSRVRELGLPAVIVQEGGYDPGTMGECVAGFLDGLSSGGSA